MLFNFLQCVKVPSTTDLITLSPLGCGLGTGYVLSLQNASAHTEKLLTRLRAGTIFNVLRPSKESTIVIFGLGAVGCAALFASAVLDLSQIIVVDLFEYRLEFAKTVGATHVLDGKDPEMFLTGKILTLLRKLKV